MIKIELEYERNNQKKSAMRFAEYAKKIELKTNDKKKEKN